MAIAGRARTYALAVGWFIVVPILMIGGASAVGNVGATLPVLFLAAIVWLGPPVLLILRRRPPPNGSQP